MKWREAFIAALVVIILSPVSLSISYYINRALASPKLSIKYVSPVITTLPTAVDTTNAALMFQLQGMLGPFVANPLDATLQQCHHQLSSGALEPACVTEVEAVLKQAIPPITGIQDQIEGDEKIISDWQGKGELPPLTPLPLPDLPAPIEELAEHDRQFALRFFGITRILYTPLLIRLAHSLCTFKISRRYGQPELAGSLLKLVF